METDQKTARVLLECRRDGYSIWSHLRAARGRYVLRILACIGLLALAVLGGDAGLRVFCVWAFGMLVGAMIRDVAWLRAIKAKWSFMCEVLDWAKLEAIAGGRGVGNGSSEVP